jgi:hypothetical protein
MQLALGPIGCVHLSAAPVSLSRRRSIFVFSYLTIELLRRSVNMPTDQIATVEPNLTRSVKWA